jgi:hypothetical protein
MKTRPSDEAVSERKAIPPLSQSRCVDMACETLYVRGARYSVNCSSRPQASSVWKNYFGSLILTMSSLTLVVRQNSSRP